MYYFNHLQYLTFLQCLGLPWRGRGGALGVQHLHISQQAVHQHLRDVQQVPGLQTRGGHAQCGARAAARRAQDVRAAGGGRGVLQVHSSQPARQQAV